MKCWPTRVRASPPLADAESGVIDVRPKSELVVVLEPRGGVLTRTRRAGPLSGASLLCGATVLLQTPATKLFSTAIVAVACRLAVNVREVNGREQILLEVKH